MAESKSYIQLVPKTLFASFLKTVSIANHSFLNPSSAEECVQLVPKYTMNVKLAIDIFNYSFLNILFVRLHTAFNLNFKGRDMFDNFAKRESLY